MHVCVEEIYNSVSQFMKLNKYNNIESKIDLANKIEHELRNIKKHICDEIEQNSQVLKIASIEYKNILKDLDNPAGDSCMNFIYKNVISLSKKDKKKLPTNINYVGMNLELMDIDCINNLVNQLSLKDKNKECNSNKNHIQYFNLNELSLEKIDIGFNNIYQIHTISHINDDNIHKIPFDLLIYDKAIKQIIIKVGNSNNFKIINSRLYHVYNQSRSSVDNSRSILCNNNLKSKNLICSKDNCRYYHDPYLGYKYNYHSDRQFSNNPVVYECSNFKSGEFVKKNTQTVQWHEAINMYQASLSNLLIACIHSTSK
jgi:hypothetical protein